jgi:DNA mismatch endonuclease (patch repair protein)
MMHIRNPSNVMSTEELSRRSEAISRALRSKMASDSSFRQDVENNLPKMWRRSHTATARKRAGRTLHERYAKGEIMPVWQGKRQPAWMIEKRIAPLRGRRMNEDVRLKLGDRLRSSARQGKLRVWYASPKSQQMVRANGKKTWELHRKDLVPFFNPAIGSRLEAELAARLREEGLRVETNVPLLGWGRTVPDYVIRGGSGEQLIVYLDGCMWHGCSDPSCKTGRSGQLSRLVQIDVARKKDVRQTAMLKRLGFHVLRVWEHEVHRSMDEVARRIVHEAS